MDDDRIEKIKNILGSKQTEFPEGFITKEKIKQALDLAAKAGLTIDEFARGKVYRFTQELWTVFSTFDNSTKQYPNYNYKEFDVLFAELCQVMQDELIAKEAVAEGQNPILHETVGAVGSGKSTLFDNLIADGTIDNACLCDPDQLFLKKMPAYNHKVDEYKQQIRSDYSRYRNWLVNNKVDMGSEDQNISLLARYKAYEYLRPISNLGSNLFLCLLLVNHYNIAHGTTSSAQKRMLQLWQNLPEGYQKKLYAVYAAEDDRKEAVVERNSKFVQSSIKDFNGKMPAAFDNIAVYLPAVDSIGLFYNKFKDGPAEDFVKFANSVVVDDTAKLQVLPEHEREFRRFIQCAQTELPADKLGAFVGILKDEGVFVSAANDASNLIDSALAERDQRQNIKYMLFGFTIAASLGTGLLHYSSTQDNAKLGHCGCAKPKCPSLNIG